MSDNAASPVVPTLAGQPSRRWPALLIGLVLVAGVAGGLGWLLHKPKVPAAILAGDKLGLILKLVAISVRLVRVCRLGRPSLSAIRQSVAISIPP